jgi:hypothetical protein
VTAPQSGEIEVEDQLERRIRKPVDLLRCVVSCAGIVALAVAGIAASATMSGLETGIGDASRRLPHALVVLASTLALFALFILPVAMAVQLLVRRQFRRVGEAVATGVLATVVTAVANDLLTRSASRLHYAIVMARPGTSHAAALDPYLAGLVAYATVVGLAGRPYWRNALWAAIAVYAIVQAGASRTSVLSLLITVIAGRAIGLAVRYAAGSASQRPGALDIAGALAADGLPVTAIPRVRRQSPRQGNPSRHYAVATKGEAAGWTPSCTTGTSRRPARSTGCTAGCRSRGQVSRNAPLSVDRVVERRALLSYAAKDASAPTPRLRAVVRVGPEAAVLACEHHDGTTLAERPGCGDAELTQIWDAVGLGHRTGPPAAVGLVRAGRPRPDRTGGAGHPRRAAGAARPPVADAGAGAAAAAGGRAAPGQARPGSRRHAAEPVLHLLPGRLRGGIQSAGAAREDRRGVPDRRRHRLDHSHAGRYRRSGSGADAGLTAAGVPGAAAASAVLLFRLLTFWLPVPFGWGALRYLERQQAV